MKILRNTLILSALGLSVLVNAQTQTTTCKLTVNNQTKHLITVDYIKPNLKEGSPVPLPTAFTKKIQSKQEGMMSVYQVPVPLPAAGEPVINLTFKMQNHSMPFSFKLKDDCKFSLISPVHHKGFTMSDTAITFGGKK